MPFSSEITPGKYVTLLDFWITLNETSADMQSIFDLLYLSKIDFLKV